MPKVKLFSITISILLFDFAVGNNTFYYEKGCSIIIGHCAVSGSNGSGSNVRLIIRGRQCVGVSYDARFKGDSAWVSRSVSGTVSASGTGTRFMVSACRWRSTTWQVEENIISRSEPECPTGCILTRLRKARPWTLPDGSTGTAPAEVRTTQWGNFLTRMSVTVFARRTVWCSAAA